MKRAFVPGLVLLCLLAQSVAAQSEGTIKIVKPGDRRNVELGQVEVTVEISGVSLEDGYSWQVMVDGVPQGIVRTGTTTVINVPKPTGPHRLAAQLYGKDGAQIGADDILVMAAPVETHEQLFNRGWFSPLMAGFVVVVVGLIFLGLRLRPRTAV